jgi:tetratricopeptide (TPR) repeat protein
LAQAIAGYERAISLQPDLAPAYAGLARSWLERGIWGAVEFRQSETPARNAAVKALELDPSSADAHAVAGHVSAFYDADWQTAENEYRRAIALDPNNVFAHRYLAATLEALGRFPESLDEAQRALALAPVSALLESAYARHLFRAREFDESIHHYQRAIELDAHDFGEYTRLAEVYEQTGRFGEAVALIEKALRMQDAALVASPALGRAYALAGRRAEALEILTYVTKHGSNPRWVQGIALIYFALGDRDHGFEYLRKAFDQRQFLIYLKVDPRFDSVREDRRFQSLVHRLGLLEGR